jgi:hypothetical protein
VYSPGFVKRYIATLDRRFGRTKLSEFTGDLVRSYQGRRLEKGGLAEDAG